MSTPVTKEEKNIPPIERAMRTLVDARIPVMLVSAPGMGKTATVRALAEEMGYDLITITASRMDAQDISGFPTRGEYERVDDDGNLTKVPVTEYAPQSWQNKVIDKKKVIVFFDEFSNAMPQVRASLLSFIQDRQFPNGEYFPEETVLIGAMNPVDSAADGYELDKATSNRIAFLAWRQDFNKWVDGVRVNWGKPCSEKESEWRSNVSRFITDNAGFLHRENDPSIGTTEAYNVDVSDSSQKAVLSYAWASGRSWDNLARALGEETSNSTYVEDLIMRGIVGAEAAMHFRRWINENSKLKVADIIAKPDDFKRWDSISANDVAMILRSAIDGATIDTVYNVARIFEILADEGRESLAAGYISDFTQCHHSFSGDMNKDDFNALVKRLFEVMGRYSEITRNK